MPNIFSARKSVSSQGGASLIEVMVSVFIFTIGVLGFASLQTRSVQATFDNGQRDQVVWMTQSLVDRIRLNADSADQYVTDLTDFKTASCAALTPATCGQTSGSGAGLTCTANQLAVWDVWDVLCSNVFQGTSAIKDLEIDLECEDTAPADGVCDDGDLDFSVTWCSRAAESTADLQTAADDVCENTIAQMEYNLSFRP